MTQPQDPRKQPLQDDEIALARVLRALPAAEPPASVDAAILRAATDAVSPGRRKPAGGLRWLPTWAIGTAAAAVLAVGIGVQLRPPLAPEAGPASVSEAVKPLPQARERLSVDLVEPDQAIAPPPASAPPEPRFATRPAPPPAPPKPVAAPAPPSPPAPAAMAEAFPANVAPQPREEVAERQSAPSESNTLDSIEVSGSRIRREPTDQARRAHQEAYARRAEAKAMSDAASGGAQAARESAAPRAQALPAQASAAAPPPLGQAADASADAAPAFNESETDAAPGALPPIARDAELSPAVWLDRIRERRRQGDTAGARASLRLFLRAHPAAPVPSDLDRLR